MEMYTLIMADGRGKVKKTLEGISKGMLKMVALTKTSGKGTSIIVNESNEIQMVVLGMGQGNYPKVITDEAEIFALGIEMK